VNPARKAILFWIAVGAVGFLLPPWYALQDSIASIGWIKEYAAKDQRTLVARVVGRTAESEGRKGPARSGTGGQVYREIWAALLDYLKANGDPLHLNMEQPTGRFMARVRSMGPQLPVDLSLAPSKGRLTVFIGFRDATGGKTPVGRRWAEFAYAQRARIEPRVEGSLEWHPNDDTSWWVEYKKTGLADLRDGFPWLIKNVPSLLDAFKVVYADLPTDLAPADVVGSEQR